MDEGLVDKLSSLPEVSKVQLKAILTSVPGNKDLTIEPNLIKPLERICGVSWLKSHGVEKIYKMQAVQTKTTSKNIQLFMIYTNIKTFQTVLQQIQSFHSQINENIKDYHIICIPRSLFIFEQLIEANGLWSNIKLYSFQWFPIHLDASVLSLELPTMFKSLYIDEDYTLLPVFAKSLWHLFLTIGKPNFILSLGAMSNVVVKQLGASTEKADSDIGGLIVMDRTVDYASALLTPVTYTALLHDIYGINCGVCKLSPDTNKLDEQFNKVLPKQAVNFVLDSKKDSVYQQIKDKSFVQVTEILRDHTKDLKVQGETSEMALHEMKRYVQTKLQSVAHKKQLLACHLNAAETVVHFLQNRLHKLAEIEVNILQNQSKSKSFASLEEYLQTERDAPSAFALFLLVCITQKLTVADAEVKSFLMKFFIEFGYDKAHSYQKLIRANLVDGTSAKLKLPSLSKSSFFTNANRMKQINTEPQNVNLKHPTCCSYVFGGHYVPLVAQIASLVLSGTPMDDVRSRLQGFGELTTSGQFLTAKKCLMVYVIGGITYSEIAALNLLETLIGVKIIKVSDRIISKSDVANAFFDAADILK